MVLHAAKHGGDAHLHPVAASTAKDAIGLMTWFAAQQERLLARYLKSADKEKFAFALKFVNQSAAGITARDLARESSVHFEDADEARRVLNELESEGRIKSFKGRKSMIFHRLPKADPRA